MNEYQHCNEALPYNYGNHTNEMISLWRGLGSNSTRYILNNNLKTEQTDISKVTVQI